jgi:hypothetical protein
MATSASHAPLQNGDAQDSVGAQRNGAHSPLTSLTESPQPVQTMITLAGKVVASTFDIPSTAAFFYCTILNLPLQLRVQIAELV